MIVDFEYFLTVLVVIPHSQLTEAALAILVTQEAVVGVYFVTSKLGIVALTLANSKEVTQAPSSSDPVSLPSQE